MGHLKTENCIMCGKKAKNWHGFVLASQKMALGNYVEKKVIAGFCDKHNESLTDDCGCYGNYDPELMGKCVPLFE